MNRARLRRRIERLSALRDRSPYAGERTAAGHVLGRLLSRIAAHPRPGRLPGGAPHVRHVAYAVTGWDPTDLPVADEEESSAVLEPPARDVELVLGFPMPAYYPFALTTDPLLEPTWIHALRAAPGVVQGLAVLLSVDAVSEAGERRALLPRREVGLSASGASPLEAGERVEVRLMGTGFDHGARLGVVLSLGPERARLSLP